MKIFKPLCTSIFSIFTLIACNSTTDLDLYSSIALTDVELMSIDKEEVISNADRYLTDKIYTVVDKKTTPPSGDKHDYISMGPYWWPNPETEDGLPYIRKDGEINPERYNYTDETGLKTTVAKVNTLGKAYYLTQNREYAAKIDEIIYKFFVDDSSRMNPNLQFGQFVPGRCEGRGIGIIETSHIVNMLNGIALVRNTKEWDSSTDAALKEWIREFLNWLQTHQYGLDESIHPNNHGTYYDVQSIAMYLFIDDIQGAKDLINRLTLDRIAKQIPSDGSQPHELARTKSWDYASMNLLGWCKIAIMAEKIGVDLWNYAPNGQNYLKSMIDWFIPYLQGDKSWEWEQISTMKIDTIEYVFRLAAKRYGDPRYNTIIENQVLIK